MSETIADRYNESRQMAVNIDGSINTTAYYLEIAKGNVPNVSSLFKFGRNSSSSTVEQIVWDGQDGYTFLSSAETMDIVSDSTDDTSSGSGARTIIVYGLNSDFEEVSEVVVLSGTTPVTTTNSFIRFNRMIVLTSGTGAPIGDANIGTITATSSSTATLQAKILPGNGQTLMAIYTVPAGKTGYVTGVGASVASGRSVLLKYKFRNLEASSNGSFSVKYTIDLFENAISQDLKTPLAIPEKTDVVVTCISSAVGTAVSASFGMILINN